MLSTGHVMYLGKKISIPPQKKKSPALNMFIEKGNLSALITQLNECLKSMENLQLLGRFYLCHRVHVFNSERGMVS